jgi:hypothetical protein|tara:strand:+ start:33 stop:236 length:204 start_codon:yes stop_codon:yes gene_type:complete
MRFSDDTKWFSIRPNLGVDYVLVVDCAAGGVFECKTVELAEEAIRNASRKGCGYMLRTEDIITKEKN